MLRCLVVQPFLLAMPTDINLAIKAKNNCSEFTQVVQQGLSAQYTILVKIFPSLPPSGDDRGLGLFCAMPSNKLGTLLGGAVIKVCVATSPKLVGCITV